MILIHLVNMLIAIMGETFTRRNDAATQIKIRDHLRFVLDNWHFVGISIGNLDNFQYIVCAQIAAEGSNEAEIIGTLKEELEEMHKQITTCQEQNSRQILQKLEDIQTAIMSK